MVETKISESNHTVNQNLLEAFSADDFQKEGHKVIDILFNYLNISNNRNISANSNLDKVLPWVAPKDQLNNWQTDFSKEGGANLAELLSKVVENSHHLHNPKYMGHQVAVPLPKAALVDLVMACLNNGATIYEMSPVATAIEHNMIKWMASKIGYDANLAGGVFTAGGSLGNLTALIAAREAAIKENEKLKDSELSILVSEQAHFSIKRAAKIMGLGDDGVIPVKTDNKMRLDPVALELALNKAKELGRDIFAVVSNSCCTATGCYDPIEALADFCEKHKIWLHVDGAHGAPVLLSNKNKSLLKGIERADSVNWDAHKMMMVPSLCTAVIFKNAKHSFEVFQEKASYLLPGNPEEEWYNISHRTVECTKNTMALKLYVSMAVHGTQIFSDYVDSRYDLAKEFASMIKSSNDFELACEPDSNIVCFKYIPEELSSEELDQLQARIRQSIIEDGEFYIVQTKLKTGLHLRVSLMNPLTSKLELEELLNKIRNI